ncbi:MAG: HAH_0734 family protein [Halobacteriaceae archaeon]
MKRLIIHGDPGVRKDGVVEVGGEEQVLFQVTRNGDWHGPDEVQLWCIAGTEDERADYEEQNYVPHFLDTESVDADAVEVLQESGETAV